MFNKINRSKNFFKKTFNVYSVLDFTILKNFVTSIEQNR